MVLAFVLAAQSEWIFAEPAPPEKLLGGGGDLIAQGEISFWQPAILGRFWFSSDTTAGTSLDFHDDLGLNGSVKSYIYDYRVEAGVPLLGRISFSTYEMSFRGFKHINRTYEINGYTYSANFDVNSTLTFLNYSILYVKDGGISLTEDLVLSIGGQVGIQYRLTDLDVQGTNGSSSVSYNKRLELPIPVVGPRASVKLFNLVEVCGSLQVFTSFGPANYSSAVAEASFIDFTIEARVWPIGNFLAAGIGYRTVQFFLRGRGDLGAGSPDFMVYFQTDGYFLSLIAQF